MMWIDCDLKPGDAGFLVEITNDVKGSQRFELRDRPPTTNQSHMPRARGWCGTTNDVAVYGRGVWRVAKVAKNGRCKLEEITVWEEVLDFLEEYGYPDLLDEIVPERN